MRARIISLAIVIGVAFVSSSVRAETVAWPTTHAPWTAVTASGNPYVDPLYSMSGDHVHTPANPDTIDLVGGIDQASSGPFASIFRFATADHVMFRVRVDNDPSLSQNVWQILLNNDADSEVDWALQLDLSLDDQVELVQGVSGGPASVPSWDPIVLSPTAHYGTPSSEPATDFYRFVNASLLATGDGSSFDGPSDDDYFVDMAFRRADFEFYVGTGMISAAAATSTSHTSSLKDLPDGSWSDGFIPVATSTSSVPEPLVWAQLAGIGLAMLPVCLLRRRARFSRRRS